METEKAVRENLAREVVISCARAHLSQDDEVRLARARAQGVDWQQVYTLAERHRVLPLLLRQLKERDWEQVPEGFRSTLESFFQLNAAHTFSLSRELLRLEQLFAAHRIEMASFKGPTLAAQLYGSPAWRQFGDLDIFVSRREVLRARELLMQGGYHLRVPLEAAQDAAHFRDESVYDLMREKPDVMLEMHWSLTTRSFARPLRLEHLLAHLYRAPLAGGEATYLGREDLLLLLCIHGTKHLWERLSWICDVADLLRAQDDDSPLDWDRLQQLAERFAVRRMVALGLILAHEILAAPLPPEVMRWAHAQKRVQVLAAHIGERLFAEKTENEEGSEIAQARALMEMMDEWPDRVRFVWHIVSTPSIEERAALVLPGPLEHLRPIVRATRLMWTHGTQAVSARFGRKSRV